jgi:acetyl-CoA carboxylase biotin carboxylase subunit
VTELVSGVDLVELQIKIAEGQELPFKQEDIKLNGWAIECRINAEDVQAGFSPNLGIIEKIAFPRGKNIRVDSGVTDYSVVTPYFDSMIAKLIIHADTRDKAITASMAALRKFWIKGIKTTIPFCLAVMNNKQFRKGNFNTSFIEKEMTKLYFNEEEDEMLAAYVAAFDFAAELETNRTTLPDFERGKNISPWVLNKRLKSL